MDVNEKSLNELKNKINNSVKMKVKEASLKLPIGKQSMKDEDIIENVMTVYKESIKALPRDLDNIKNIEVKFTMTKPQKIKIR